MENTEIKKVKMTDEKYCSECGETIKINAEICPKCGVRQVAISDVIASTKYKYDKLGEKFLFSGGATFMALLLWLFGKADNPNINGMGVAFMIALVAGLLGMAIPTREKIIYIPISITVGFLLVIGIIKSGI